MCFCEEENLKYIFTSNSIDCISLDLVYDEGKLVVRTSDRQCKRIPIMPTT
jgi:hypothetical protein